MAQMVNYIETTENGAKSLAVKPGQLLYLKDTRKALFDSSENIRVDLSDIIILATEEERKGIASPIEGKLYLVTGTKQLYAYTGTEWITPTPDYTDVYVSKSGDTITGDLTVEQTLSANKVVIGDGATLEYDAAAKCVNFVFA